MGRERSGLIGNLKGLSMLLAAQTSMHNRKLPHKIRNFRVCRCAYSMKLLVDDLFIGLREPICNILFYTVF